MGATFRPEIYDARELALAAGAPVEQVEALMATGELPSLDGRFVVHGEAVTWGRRYRQSRGLAAASVLAVSGTADVSVEPPAMFDASPAAPRQPALPAAISAAAHVLAGAVAVLITTMGLGSAAAARTEYRIAEPTRLVFLPIPGPGGGGGGGGLKQHIPPPPAKRKGTRTLRSPLPEQAPPAPIEPPKIEAPPPPPVEEPPIVAPVARSASDDTDRPGLLEKSENTEDSHGAGENGGVGTGQGTGIGEGQGSGIGPGSGGGTGGGPYRPGSGIQPPTLLREVKPDYTDEARRRNITGEVLLEIVVRSDGQVGDVRVLDGLGYGLDQRAVDAVRQWRFSPARRQGQVVDVLVEVAVEFRLR